MRQELLVPPEVLPTRPPAPPFSIGGIGLIQKKQISNSQINGEGHNCSAKTNGDYRHGFIEKRTNK